MDRVYLALVAAVAAFAAISFPCLLIAFLCRHRKNRLLEPDRRCLSSSSLPVRVSTELSSSWSLYGSSIDASLKKLSLDDLARATGDFSPDNIIGDGSFGFVYRAVLPDGGAVAVKRLSADHAAGAGNREFRAELEVLGSLSHRNLARLLGYCATGRDRLLVYELLERGSLDAWLHGDGAGGTPLLPWIARLRVTRGVAAALAFLHHDCHPPVLHRDVKSSNVLLDEGFEAKLADFGHARVVTGGPAASHVSTQAAGTVGYMAPEIRQGVGASIKADVYSFGVLMIEIVAGRRPSWPMKNIGGKEVEPLKWAREKVEAGLSLEIADCRLQIEVEKETKEVEAFLDIAHSCTEECPKYRPTMKEVVEMLTKI
ncbi:brassinosteroid LRR receptor kinase BRL2-like [Lolium rigidum]|uniref:brassinosteroid LRR receptor kinase BRL2-like n=1 Tax=Lolium rigidum TaxID=89674 RepID=UPI001F5C8937|nr:brassinosteroid LRR receptor kinase BRL2-like [Lolium rigidum]